MTKPFSDAEFSAQITEDRSWRLKEISDLKSAINRADEQLCRVLLRALIPICYAHWEGYVRFAARKYLEYIALRKFPYRELDRQFLRNYFLPRLASASVSNLSISDRCHLVDDILNSSEKRFSRVNTDLISTRSNLNFEVFSDICLVCAISSKKFSDQSTFINILLLKRRNSIAHGEDTFIALEDLDEITNQTIFVMRAFGDELENQVALKIYKTSSY